MDDRALQELVSETAVELGLAGAQVAVLQKGEVREFGAGARDLELGLPVTTDTLFQIGSTTKVINAALVMTLVDEGRLELDAPVHDIIGDFRLADAIAQQNVTLRQLLSMTSGADNGPYHSFGRGDDALSRYIGSLSGVPHIFAPGTAYGYSNAGTNVAGYAATRVTGKAWEQLLFERLLKPLALQRTSALPEHLIFHPLALGYLRTSPGVPLQRLGVWDLGRSMAPAGATLCSCAGDLVRFAGMLMKDGQSEDSGCVLSKAAVQTMHEPQVELPAKLMAEKWCVGPYWKSWGGHSIYGHSGTNLNGSSTLLWCPNKQFALAALTNVSAQGYPLAERISDVVFPALCRIDKPLPPIPAEIAPAPVDLSLYVGRFEALGITMHFEANDGKLFATADTYSPLGGKALLKSELIPLGGNRFLPREPVFSGNRCWDVAFWTEGENDRPTHYLNGAFPLRRTG